eukprot:GSMAST32.ASY1.ANO1.1923.1 assembled CDS
MNDGALSYDALIRLRPEQLATKKRKKLLEEQREAKFQERRVDYKINKQAGIQGNKGLFKCRRCHKWKTTNYQKQTRCADEPMTVFVQCLNCGNRWRC